MLQLRGYKGSLAALQSGYRWKLARWSGTRARKLHKSAKTLNRSSPLESIEKLTVGDRLHGYTVEGVSPLPEFDATAAELTHDKTKAKHLHIARKDANNTFSVGFRTTPMDSTGVAHILEHTTLCGSKQFPIRDPFFKMLTRSLTSFMNAFTASDWTLYPFSSQNNKDFNNLLSVYLDCVFYPRLRENDFRQEGWRLEHENPQDPTTPIIFKGVVFNEMKGVFASPESVFVQALQNKLLPGHTYSHVSGGWPNDILDLTWESLRHFHSSHYHPTNARFFTYGDMPLGDHLQFINEKALTGFELGSPSVEIPLEQRWTQPRTDQISCAPDPMATDPEKQTTVAVSFLQAPSTDPYESLVLSILGHLLVDGPTSPFYQALLDTNIGSDYSPSTGYDNSTLDTVFSVGLQGIRREDANRVEEIVLKTLETVAVEGFHEDRVRSVLHQVELSVKHQSSSFGLGLITSLMSPWIHGGDPVSMTRINEHVERFKENLKTEGYLQEKIKQYYLNNSHRLTLIMSPQADYEEKLAAEEQHKLLSMVTALSKANREEVYRKGVELLEEQNSNESADCLPTVVISDVDKVVPPTELDHLHSGGIPVQYTEQPTNGLTYLRATSSLSMVPDHLKIYVPLFSSVITNMGAGDLDYRDFNLQCELYSGGLSMFPHVSAHHTSPLCYDQGVVFSSHCLNRHLPHMLSLWEDVFTKPNLSDVERLSTLVKMSASSLASNVAASGHSYAMTAAASGLSASCQLGELFSGMTQVEFLKDLASKEDLSDVLHNMALIAAELLDSGSLRCALNTNSGNYDNVMTAMDGWVDTLPGSRTDQPGPSEESDFERVSTKMYYQLPFPVHYVGAAVPTVPYTHPDSPRLTVLAKLLSSKFLHREIREKGGAYGSGAVHQGGVFSFMSYRDPHCLSTLETFHRAAVWGARGEFSNQDITEALLTVFSKIDSPVSPGARGRGAFLTGVTDEMRQAYRDQLFTVGRDELQSVAQKYLVDYPTLNCAIIGPKNNKLSDDWTTKVFDL